tara:strand:+ start:649 stop:1230 length:582 start_codon:yes stop_codon:yes gene_type:complete
MKRIACAVSIALALSACGDASADNSSELATAKAEAAAAKAETAAMKAELAVSGASNGANSPAATPQKAAASTAPKAEAKPANEGKYRMPTADELANGVNANCDVELEAYTYSGPCLFDSFGGASFMVSRADGYPMNPQFEEVIIEADTSKIAMMTIRNADGDLDVIGQVRRASTKDACWTGDMNKVCAYAKDF